MFARAKDSATHEPFFPKWSFPWAPDWRGMNTIPNFPIRVSNSPKGPHRFWYPAGASGSSHSHYSTPKPCSLLAAMPASPPHSPWGFHSTCASTWVTLPQVLLQITQPSVGSRTHLCPHLGGVDLCSVSSTKGRSCFL